jgi:hypothetical protein
MYFSKMINKTNNPYGDTLVGLNLDNPVSAFFEFCLERENVRKKRESGDPFPWTDNPVIQKGKFLNVFREDDKGTKAVLNFVKKTETQTELIHALFFARWCNLKTTLDILNPKILKTPFELAKFLSKISGPWQSEVYPVVPASWADRMYDRIEASVEMFPLCIKFIEQCIVDSNGDVMIANNSINAQLKMSNDFPIFMALVDLALFRPDLISPDSPVPTGIGAEPFLDLLQTQLGCDNHQQVADKMIDLQSEYWPDAKRKFRPIDIEYLSCECRKYYSYINETKKFEGKNLFFPSSGK